MRSALSDALDLKEKLHHQRWVVPVDDKTIEVRKASRWLTEGL